MAITNLVKKINERSIITCMRDGKVHTKQELARLTGLSFPTVGKVIEELVRDDMLLGLGADLESQGGRKAELYKINQDYAHVLLLFLQGKKVYYRISDALGETLESGEKEDEEALPFVLLKECLAERLSSDTQIKAVAVGLPGSVYNGTVYCMDGYEGMVGRNIAEELYEQAKVPVMASNNMNIVAMGMAKEETTVCLHLADTGPGLGAVVNGRPVCGFSGFQGEVGFMPLYGEKNVQDIALDGFSQASAGECMARVIACVCTVLNPRCVICYLEPDESALRQEITQGCQRYLPEYARPELVFDRNYKEDYLAGLMAAGLALLYQDGVAEYEQTGQE